MKKYVFIVLIISVLSCSKESDTSGIPNIKTLEHKNTKQTQAKDSTIIEEIIFGTFAGECMINCAPMFRLDLITNTLEADLSENYFESTDSLVFSAFVFDHNQLDSALGIIPKIPKVLLNLPKTKYRFGCPDCTDGGGVYFKVKQKSIKAKEFWLDLYQDPHNKKIPDNVLDFSRYISKVVHYDLLETIEYE